MASTREFKAMLKRPGRVLYTDAMTGRSKWTADRTVATALVKLLVAYDHADRLADLTDITLVGRLAHSQTYRTLAVPAAQVLAWYPTTGGYKITQIGKVQRRQREQQRQGGAK